MEIDTLATHDAQAIQRLVDNGEPLSTSAAAFGYTPSEAQELLDHAASNHHILVGWWKDKPMRFKMSYGIDGDVRMKRG